MMVAEGMVIEMAMRMRSNHGKEHCNRIAYKSEDDENEDDQDG